MALIELYVIEMTENAKKISIDSGKKDLPFTDVV
jgi:hypothetical protein